MKYLGIDYGEKRVGLSVSDDTGKIAFPRSVFENSDNLIKDISKIIKMERIDKVVMGDSKNYNLKDNPIMSDIRDFSKKLADEANIEVIFHPEFMSSMQAEKLRAFEMSRYDRKTKARFKGVKSIDDSAAAIILQSYLESASRKE